MVFENILIYHLDNEIHKLFDIERIYSINEIKRIFALAIRIAYLIAKEKLIIPASNYFESPIAYNIINELGPLNEYGIIQLSTKSISLDSFLKKKRDEHDLFFSSSGYQYSNFENSKGNGLFLPFTLTKKKISSSKFIQDGWINSIGKTSIWSDLYGLYPKGTKSDFFESELDHIPDRLEKRAYISSYIVPFLSVEKENRSTAEKIVNEFITEQYIKSYLCEYQAYCLKDIPYIDSSRILPDDMEDHFISYSHFASLLKSLTWNNIPAFDYIGNCDVMDLVLFKNSQIWHNALNVYEKGSLHFMVKEKNSIVIDSNTFGGGHSNMNKHISVFVSYSTDSEVFQKRVATFVNELREYGFDATQDIDLINQYGNFTNIMSCGLQKDKVIIILSPSYKIKADNIDEKSGVRSEATIIYDDMQKNPNKYIFVSFDAIDGDTIEKITPVLFKGCQIIDLTNDKIQNGYNMLFSRLEDNPIADRPKVSDNKPIIKKI